MANADAPSKATPCRAMRIRTYSATKAGMRQVGLREGGNNLIVVHNSKLFNGDKVGVSRRQLMTSGYVG